MPRKILAVPNQHGAWAFLVVPLILGAFLGAATWLGLVFAITWIAAYPVSYFAGRGILMRIRRGAFTAKTRAAFRDALPWAVVTVLGGVILVVARPWILVPGAVVAAIWSISLWLTWIGRERGITNDLLLTVLASIAAPLMWAVANGEPSVAAVPRTLWLAAVVCLLFFTGSVLHIKSLIREADDRRWHWASVAFHVLALVIAVTISWWLAIPFTAALVRTAVIRPGLRPGQLGAIETVVSVLLVVCTAIALS